MRKPFFQDVGLTIRDNEYASVIDATIVRAHQHSAGARKKGGSTKLWPPRGGLHHQDPCDRRRRGQPVGSFRLTGGQVHDITQAEALAAEVKPEALLGDKSYDAGTFIESLEVRAIKPVIPPKTNSKDSRDCDFAPLRRTESLIERFFQFIKLFRGIATG